MPSKLATSRPVLAAFSVAAVLTRPAGAKGPPHLDGERTPNPDAPAPGFVVATPDFDLVSTTAAVVVLGADAEGAPIELARLTELPSALAMAVDGEIGLVAARDSVWVVDFAIPSQPAILAGFGHSDDSGVSSVDIAGELGYVLSYNSPLLDLIDLSDPSAPQSLGAWEVPRGWGVDGLWGQRVTAGESGAVYVHYVRFHDGHYPWDDRWYHDLTVFDVEGTAPGSLPVSTIPLSDGLDYTDPQLPPMAGTSNLLLTPYFFSAAYDPEPAVALWDLDLPLSPSGRWSTGGDTDPLPPSTRLRSLALFDCFATVLRDDATTRLTTLWLVDGGEASELARGGIAERATLSGTAAHLSVFNDNGSATVLRFRSPNVCWVGRLEGLAEERASGHWESRVLYARAAGLEDEWTLVDASNPGEPRVHGIYELPGEALGTPVVLGDLAAATCGEDVCLFDLTDPLSPVRIVSIPLSDVDLLAFGCEEIEAAPAGSDPRAAIRSSQRIYLHSAGTDWSEGVYRFQSLDVTDPSDPIRLGEWTAPRPQEYWADVGLEADGNVAVFAASRAPTPEQEETRVATWIATPDSVVPVAWMTMPEAAQSMAAHDRFLVVSHWSNDESCRGWLSSYELSDEGALDRISSTLWFCEPRGPGFTNLVSAPNGIFYLLEDSAKLRAVELDEAGGLVEAELPTPVAELEGCGDPWDSSLVPLRGALAMGCSESRALTIVPIDQETTPPALLGVWVDENE